MDIRNLERSSIWLTGIIALLTVVILWELGRSSTPSVSDDAFRRISTALPELHEEEFGLPSRDAFAEIIDRPLFSSTRRPFIGTTNAVPQPVNVLAPPVWSLIGTVITPGKRSALFLSQRGGQFIRLEVGMSSEGWELTDVTTDAVTLVRGDRSHKISLSQQ